MANKTLDSKLRFTEGHTSPEDEKSLRELAKAIEGGSIDSYRVSPLHVIGGLTGLVAVVSMEGCATLQGPEIVYPVNFDCPVIGSDYSSLTNPDGSIRDPYVPHNGIDITENIGYPVIAAADGTVIKAGFKANTGNRVLIYHGRDVEGLHIYSNSLRMDSINVETGQNVKRGDKLGTVGNTGSNLLSRGGRLPPHLHFEVWVSRQSTYTIREDDSVIMHGARHVNPHSYWLKERQVSNFEKIIVPPFIAGKEYPTKPIRFTSAYPLDSEETYM